MKICYITHNYPRYEGDYSGLPFKHIAEELSKKGYEFTIITPHEKGLPKYEKRGKVEVFRFLYGRNENIAYTGKMQKFLKDPRYWHEFFNFFKYFYRTSNKHSIKCDILHTHWLIPTGLIGKFIFSDRKLISLHGSDVRLFSKFKLDNLARYFLQSYNYILPVSKFLETTVSKWVEKNKIHTMPFITNVDNFIYKPVEHLSDKISLLTVSRISNQKNIETAIRAIKIIKDLGHSVNYKIIGDGEEKKRLENLTKELDLNDSIYFAGLLKHGEIPEIVRSYPVCLIPSFEEGFGISVIEARLSGRIVIGSNSGNIKHLIIDKKTGCLFNTFSPEDCANKILNVFKNKKTSLQIAEQSYREAILKYKFINQINDWYNLYNSILNLK